MVLVDSSVWIDYFGATLNPKVDQLDRILDYQDVLVGDLVMAEVLQGIDSLTVSFISSGNHFSFLNRFP